MNLTLLLAAGLSLGELVSSPPSVKPLAQAPKASVSLANDDAAEFIWTGLESFTRYDIEESTDLVQWSVTFPAYNTLTHTSIILFDYTKRPAIYYKITKLED